MDPDPDPAPDPDSTPDPTPFFGDFFQIFFLKLTRRHIIFSLKNLIFAKFCIKILFCKHYFRLLNTFMRKGKSSEPDPVPLLRLIDPETGGPKTCGSCGSGSGSGSPTLLITATLAVVPGCQSIFLSPWFFYYRNLGGGGVTRDMATFCL
jgi:hypothetical protein